jgi:hypothetical protein
MRVVHALHSRPSMLVKLSSLSLSCLLLSFAAACLPPIETGDDDLDDDDVVDPPGTTARQLFDRDVYPVLDKKCGNAGCHSERDIPNSAFVDDVATEGYVRAVADPKLVAGFTAQAPILTKISAGHFSTYSDGEVTKITKWLAKEVDERGQTRDLLREWSGCMNLSDFIARGMAPATGNALANNAGTCKACHALGEYKHIATDQPGLFFDTITTNRTYLGQYFTVDPSNTKVIVNEENFREVGEALAPHTTHPTFDSIDGEHMIVLRNFYDMTLARFTNKQCDPPRF